MNWKLAKTILIGLLLGVNLILGGIWFVRESQQRAEDARVMEDLCAVLARNGLTAAPELIPAVTALTYDAERIPGEDAKQTVKGLPVWPHTAAARQGAVISQAGGWRWGEELPVSGRPCLSAGYCLLALTGGWDGAGTLELCELGFSADALSAGAVRLKPCWRFVISGEEYYWPAV